MEQRLPLRLSACNITMALIFITITNNDVVTIATIAVLPQSTTLTKNNSSSAGGGSVITVEYVAEYFFQFHIYHHIMVAPASVAPR